MKKTARAVLFCVAACATSVIYAGQEPVGVSGVKVIVKESPDTHVLTDQQGKFVLRGLAAGSYTLSFRARELKDLPVWHRVTGNKVIVATEYSIKVDGAKSSVERGGLNTTMLLAGVNIPLKLGSGAQLRGQVLAGDPKKWVWIPKRVDSHIPGHWAMEGSPEADAHNIAAHAPHTWNFK